ncbi:ComEA family DNA-binding protein [Winogradskyella sp.]|uniref:ComEA family DNA-binding protein n=1 Tax=Winogradskyella sp. TaxID=1883156 RepID=UPI003BAD5777
MKSHFQFTNQQRNGIFLLLAIIIGLQCVYTFVDASNKEIPSHNEMVDAFRLELDSLRLVAIEERKPKMYPFNPNYITDYKGYTLGMSNVEIDRLHRFRERDQWVNSAKQFQEVTKVSDSLLAKISPYFKFPDWVTNPKPRRSFNNYIVDNFSEEADPRDGNTLSYDQKIDLNKATTYQLQKVYGVGEKLSDRIMTYRNKHKGGFIADVELLEVYGLAPEVIERIKNQFTVKTPRVIKRHNLNTATRDQLVTIPYIDYEVAHHIIEERTLRDGFKSLEELTKVEDFPINKIEIIKLYLHL